MRKFLDWTKVYFGHVSTEEVLKHVKDEKWQVVRLEMKGKTLEEKYNTLKQWLTKNDYSKKSKIQVTNYVTALSRGGLIKPSDYKKDEND